MSRVSPLPRRRNVLARIVLLHFYEVFLCVTPNLNYILRPHVCFNLLPIPIEQLQRFNEPLMLLCRPILPTLRHRVRLP